MYDLETNRDGSLRIRRKGYRVGVRNKGYKLSLTPCGACGLAIGCDEDFHLVTRSRDKKEIPYHKRCTSTT